ISKIVAIQLHWSSSYIADGIGHEFAEPMALRAGEQQAELRTSPQHVVLGLRPFMRHQVPNFRTGQVSTKTGSEIVEASGGSKDALDAGSIASHQAPGMAFSQKGPQCPRLGDELFDGIDRDIAARQPCAPGPSRPP